MKNRIKISKKIICISKRNIKLKSTYCLWRVILFLGKAFFPFCSYLFQFHFYKFGIFIIFSLNPARKK